MDADTSRRVRGLVLLPSEASPDQGLTVEGPTGALVGITGIGLGGLIAYAAWKGVPVFGPDGILTTALRTGHLQPIPNSGNVAGAGGTGSGGIDIYGNPLPVNGTCPTGFLYAPGTSTKTQDGKHVPNSCLREEG